MILKEQYDLSDNVSVITGGSGLIGKEFVEAIIQNNGIAIIADKNEEIGVATKEELSKKLNSENIDFINLDITSKDSLQACIDYLHTKYQRIDALINCAYPKNNNFGKKFFDVSFDDFVENVGLHLGGYFVTSQHFALYFKKQGFGNIINISSIYGVIPPRFEIYKNTILTTPVEYAAIKSSLIHLTKYMAKYFKGTNIRVNSISPGGIFDDQPEVFLENYKEHCLNKGILDNKDLKGSLIFLLSGMSKYINGQNIIVDDGFSL